MLRAWVCSGWESGGSFIRWLNGCAAAFEKQHDGVYIEFTPVSAESLNAIHTSGIRPPELVFFSPGMLESADGLLEIHSDRLRADLQTDSRALPVAMGGYIWVYNRALCDGIPADAPTQADDDAHSFSAAQVALWNLQEQAAPLPELGIDLGLPANAASSEGTLDNFIDGKISALVIHQSQLARLIRLRDAGRGPDWACMAAGRYAYTDQILYASVVAQEDRGQLSLATEFAQMLLESESQSKLQDIGAFAVTGERIHPELSPYASLDALINSRRIIAPGPFSKPAGWSGADILHPLQSGQISPDAAAEKLRAKFTLN